VGRRIAALEEASTAPPYSDYYFVQCDGSMYTAVSVTGNDPAYNGIESLIEKSP
jgi:hypothetical protein